MKKNILVLGLVLALNSQTAMAVDTKAKAPAKPNDPKAAATATPVEEQGLYKYSFKNIDGETVSLSQFKGKPLLIVNIATRCGYTHQLEGLQALHTQFKDKGLVVIGFPSNNFGGQTPEKEKGVKDFCKVNFGVDFLLSEKVEVLGPKKDPIFEELISAQKDKKEISWNFEKFLVKKDGTIYKRYKSSIEPSDKNLQKDIATVL